MDLLFPETDGPNLVQSVLEQKVVLTTLVTGGLLETQVSFKSIQQLFSYHHPNPPTTQTHITYTARPANIIK